MFMGLEKYQHVASALGKASLELMHTCKVVEEGVRLTGLIIVRSSTDPRVSNLIVISELYRVIASQIFDENTPVNFLGLLKTNHLVSLHRMDSWHYCRLLPLFSFKLSSYLTYSSVKNSPSNLSSIRSYQRSGPRQRPVST